MSALAWLNLYRRIPRIARQAVWKSVDALLSGDPERAIRHIREAAQTIAADAAARKAFG